MIRSKAGLLVSVVTVLLLICDNVLSHSFNLPWIKFFAAYLFIFMLARYVIKFRTNISFEWIWLICFIATLAVTSYYNLTWKPFIFGLLAVLSYKYIDWLPVINKIQVVDMLSTVLLVTLCLGCLALFFKSLGFPSLNDFNHLKLYPLGYLYGAEHRSFPRLSGFFLEPGQLSFYICAVVACRHYLQMPKQTTAALLFLGLLTQSLAHLFFVAAYLFVANIHSVSTNKFLSKKFNLFAFVVAFLIMAGNSWLWARLNVILQLDAESWQRLNSFLYALNLFDGGLNDILFGPSKELSARIIGEAHLFRSDLPGASLYGENPLTPVVFGGLLASWPYYWAIIYPIIASLRYGSNSWVLVLFMFLTLQRPYTLEFPYTFIIALVFSCYFLSNRTPKSKSVHEDRV